MLRTAAATLSVAALFLTGSTARAGPPPAAFDSVGADRAAIRALLDTYTRAVSTKNEPLFRSLLLNTSVPFSNTATAIGAGGAKGGAENYEGFRKDVFEGAPFTQRFQDVHILQDGPLADVSLVFVNTAPEGRSWGWKTLQLLEVAGGWRIASEFYTGHPY